MSEYGRGKCGRATSDISNATGSTNVKPDGTFKRIERWSLRYKDGSLERYRVNIRGRFLADGATGTFRIRMTYRKGAARAALRHRHRDLDGAAMRRALGCSPRRSCSLSAPAAQADVNYAATAVRGTRPIVADVLAGAP